jgi:hypothetical protein
VVYAEGRDRETSQLELYQTPWPAAPLNLNLSSGHLLGVFDLCWDDPAQQPLNSQFFLLGVNIYRSFDSEWGPYERITDLPLGATFWRDQTDNCLVMDEQVMPEQWLSQGAGAAYPQARWVFRTLNSPIVAPDSQAITTQSPFDVVVRVDGQLVPIKRVFGQTGEVEIDVTNWPDTNLQILTQAVRPGSSSIVTVSYRYNRSLLRRDLAQRVFYRVTTVGVPMGKDMSCLQPQDLVETPLERSVLTNSAEVEKLDWIWAEGVRRNRYILEQGGERVRLFIHKHVGTPCSCTQFEHHHQPKNDCLKCFGTGWLGGYEGPFDLLIAPDDSERRINQTEMGRSVEHTYEVWCGPNPLLTQRDFVLKLTGERYSVGPVRRPSNRGMVLQQHFNISEIDQKDIRYKVPVDLRSGPDMALPQIPPNNNGALVTERVGIPDERELRGRTLTWANIVY